MEKFTYSLLSIKILVLTNGLHIFVKFFTASQLVLFGCYYRHIERRLINMSNKQATTINLDVRRQSEFRPLLRQYLLGLDTRGAGGEGGRRPDQARGVALGKIRQMASLLPLSRPRGVQGTNGGASFCFSASERLLLKKIKGNGLILSAGLKVRRLSEVCKLTQSTRIQSADEWQTNAKELWSLAHRSRRK
jgi:hypothetical protein